MGAHRPRSIPQYEGRRDRVVLKKLKHRVSSSSFLLIKQMAKKTRKSSRKSRRTTRRRLPRRAKKGGVDLNKFPLIPDTKAIEVSTAGESSDTL